MTSLRPPHRPPLRLSRLAILPALLVFAWLGFLLTPSPPGSPPPAPAGDLDAEVRAVLETGPGRTLCQALARMVRGHQLPSGELAPALRGQGVRAHQLEVARELLDPRTPMRWRRLFQALAAWERSLPASPRRIEVRDTAVRRHLFPVLQHLCHDKGLAVSFHYMLTLRGTVAREDYRDWPVERIELLQKHLEEVYREVRVGLQRVGFLATPDSVEAEAFRALLVGVFTRHQTIATLERVLAVLERPEPIPAPARSMLVLAALHLLPTPVTSDPMPCDLRQRALDQAFRMLRTFPRQLPGEQRARLAASAMWAHFTVTAACHGPDEEVEARFRELVEEVERHAQEGPELTEIYLTWIHEMELVLSFTVPPDDPLSRRVVVAMDLLERVKKPTPGQARAGDSPRAARRPAPPSLADRLAEGSSGS